jgi:hypothetical protein
MQPNYADDLAVDDGDQDVVTLSALLRRSRTDSRLR